jgi:hypothetical protein
LGSITAYVIRFVRIDKLKKTKKDERERKGEYINDEGKHVNT